MSIAFCTLAIHTAYRRRAQRLCASWPTAHWVVLTDEPADFAGLDVAAFPHTPTGPMASDYLRDHAATGNHQGAAAYHDKRFALQKALENYDTAIYLDADSHFIASPKLEAFPPGLSITPVVRRSVAAHLEVCGSWRQPAFAALARNLTGDTRVLAEAHWCHETFYAVTKDENVDQFFDAWDRGVRFLQSENVFSGEGGVMGLAAAQAGWTPDYDALTSLSLQIVHEGGGPKHD